MLSNSGSVGSGERVVEGLYVALGVGLKVRVWLWVGRWLSVRVETRVRVGVSTLLVVPVRLSVCLYLSVAVADPVQVPVFVEGAVADRVRVGLPDRRTVGVGVGVLDMVWLSRRLWLREWAMVILGVWVGRDADGVRVTEGRSDAVGVAGRDKVEDLDNS